jgi:hypothetical protein
MNSSPPGTGGVAEGRGGSKIEMNLVDSNEYTEIDPSTTPLRATPPVPGGELLLFSVGSDLALHVQPTGAGSELVNLRTV